MNRSLPNRVRAGIPIAVLVLAACGEGPTAGTVPETTTTVATTTTSVATTTTTTSVPEQQPAEVSSITRPPDDDKLQDGTWAAIVFQQPLACIPPDADLTGAPTQCETSVIFEVEGSGELVGEEVPVWLVRQPVLVYALANGPTTIEHLRSIPTLVETTSETYSESPEGTLEITGKLPDGGDYAIEVAEATTMEIPAETTGETVALSELIGRWETNGYALRVDEGGSYELLELEADGSTNETGVFGFIATQDELLVFATSANPGPCPGETGVFFAEMRREQLHLAAVDEPCVFREEVFASSWSLSSEG